MRVCELAFAGGVLLAAIGCVCTTLPVEAGLIGSPTVSPAQLPFSGGTVVFSAIVAEAYYEVPMSVTVTITYPDGDTGTLGLRYRQPGLREVVGVYLFPGNTTGGARPDVYHTKITARTADGREVQELSMEDVIVAGAEAPPSPPDLPSERVR